MYRSLIGSFLILVYTIYNMAIARINSDQDFSKLKPGARLRISGRLFELQGTLGEGAMGKIFGQPETSNLQ